MCLAVYAKSEADYTAEWCSLHNMSYDIPGDGKRPSELVFETPTGRKVIADCVGPRAVVEVDFARKYAEGIGQTLLYRELAKREGILLLIIETPADCNYALDAMWLAWESNQRLKVVTTGQSCRE